MIRFEFDLASVEAEVRDLTAQLDRAAAEGMTAVGEAVASAARDQHPYQNRTGDLEASTRAEAPFGELSRGTLSVDVVADTDYAQYVDGRPGFEFLQPAFDRTSAEQDAAMQRALDEIK